ncbi:hypothetical protein BGC_39610 [Burkholderia sp. 3C]
MHAEEAVLRDRLQRRIKHPGQAVGGMAAERVVEEHDGEGGEEAKQIEFGNAVGLHGRTRLESQWQGHAGARKVWIGRANCSLPWGAGEPPNPDRKP